MQKTIAKTGRPTALTREVLQKLEYAFSIGCSDKEACIYADIAPSTLYKYCQEDTGFSERKELLKERPVLAARMTVVKAIVGGDTKMAWSYLERKRAGEFGRDTKPSESNQKIVTIAQLEAVARGEIGSTVEELA